MPTKSYGLFFGFSLLASLVLSVVGLGHTVLRWLATDAAAVFATVHEWKHEVGAAANQFAALIAPRSHPFATAPPLAC